MVKLTATTIACFCMLLLCTSIRASSSDQAPATATATTTQLDPNDVIYMDTTQGRVVIRMRRDLAPLHCRRISTLVRSNFYDGLVFHRVIAGFMAQGGDPDGNGRGGTRIHIPAEFSIPSVANHERGAVNMARYAGDYDSADSQFSIMFRGSHWLDGEYTIWGHVLGGMDKVDALKKGDDAQDGVVTDPDKIVKMRIPGDADPTCVDIDPDCLTYATPGRYSFSGECVENPDWMKANCPLSCGVCPISDKVQPPCESLYRDCTAWATPGQFSESGECVNNFYWMLKNCRKDCDPECQNS